MGKKKYFAFISYKREDEEWAKWFQNELENYHLPSTLNGKPDVVNELPEQFRPPKGFRPVFRDIDELKAGNLPVQIYNALKDSLNLIVVCSTKLADDEKAKWVNKEISDFIEIGAKEGVDNVEHIFPFIIDGIPHAGDKRECFPKVLRELSKEQERIGGNVNEGGDVSEINRERAFVKVLSGMLTNVDFAELWNRYDRDKMERERREKEEKNKLLISQSRFLAEKANQLVEDGDSYTARLLALEALPKNFEDPDRPYTPEAEHALRKAVKKETGVLRGHKNCVRSAVFSPDNSNVISVSDDSTINIWEAHSGSVKKTLSNHSAAILSICYNTEKSLFVTASVDQDVIIWDSKTYDVKKVIPHPSPVYYAAFSPYGNFIVTASKDSIVRIWDWNNAEKPIRELVGHTDAVRIANFSPDNTHVVSGSEDYTIKVWDLTKKDSDACIKSVELKENCIIRCADYNKTGDVIIVTADTNAYLLDVNDDYNLLCPPLKNNGSAWWACFCPKEKIIATTSSNDVCLWEFDKDKKECQLIKVLKGHSFQVIHISFSDDGCKLLSNSSDETIRLWDLTVRQEPIKYQLSVASVALFPKADVVVAASCKDSTQLLSVDNGEILVTEDQDWSPFLDDDFVFVDSEGKTVYKSDGLRVLRLSAMDFHPTRRPIAMQTPQSFYPKEYDVHFMSISPNGKMAITAFKEGKMFIWNMEDGKIIKEFNETQNMNRRSICGAFDPCSKIVATIAWEKPVQLWDIRTGVCIMELEMPHNYWGNSIQFSSDGKLLVSASQNKMVHIWNVETGKLIHNEMCNYIFNNRVLYAEFSRDNKYIVTTTAKGTISVFETASGILIDAFNIHDPNASFSRKAMFSIDSKKIIMLADNGFKENSIMKVISFCPLEELVEMTKERFKKRRLTDSEKRKYYID